MRQGLSLIEGVAQGSRSRRCWAIASSAACAIGASRWRASFAVPQAAPLRTTVPDATSGPSESIAARDVVDGVALLERWRTQGTALIDQLNALAPTPGERSAIELELRRLEDLVDSVSDIMTAESVFRPSRQL